MTAKGVTVVAAGNDASRSSTSPRPWRDRGRRDRLTRPPRVVQQLRLRSNASSALRRQSSIAPGHDGLAPTRTGFSRERQDLGHLLERSGVGAEIDARSIPLSPAYRTVAGGDLKLALGGGEDYELLFALRKERSEADLTQRLGVPVSRIGRIVRGRGARLRGDGAPAIAGWDQLKERP
ncbi:hypothetical protein IMX07_09185 [bacterium]|nr:hypothetical protein [bacterium]